MSDCTPACEEGAAAPAHAAGHADDGVPEVEYGQPADWQRFYLGYRERFVDDCVLELNGGRTRVRLAQAPSARVANKRAAKASSKGMDMDSDPALTGTTVWDGAVVLSHFLAETDTIRQHMQGVIAAEAAEAAALATAAAAEAEAAAAAAATLQPVDACSAGAPASSTSPDDAASQTLLSASLSMLAIAPPQTAQARSGLPPLRRVQPPQGPRQARCLELGAGTGAVSLALLACRAVASATITDIPDLLPHLKLNLERNAPLLDRGRAHILPLRWGPPGDDIKALPAVAAPPYDLVVGSDLIYYSYSEDTPHSDLLVWTLQRVCGPRTLILLALSLHHNAPEVHSFLKRCERAGFSVQRLKDEVPPEYQVPDVMLVRLTFAGML